MPPRNAPHDLAPADTADLRAKALLARLVALSPRVFPSVAVEADWTAALAEARAMIDHRKGTGRWTSSNT